MATQNWRRDWVTEKCEIASALARGCAGGSYSEAAILVCAVLSALAAEVWPGRRLDRVRFIELLVRLGPQVKIPMTISVPLLVRELEQASAHVNAALLKKAFLNFSPTRIVTGSEVDNTEAKILALCADLTPQIIRKYSYACILYEEVRSSYAHEYKPGERADSWPATMAEGESVSYVNRLLVAGTPKTGRLIHFHIASLAKLAIDIAADIDVHSNTVPRQAPTVWWIDGGT